MQDTEHMLSRLYVSRDRYVEVAGHPERLVLPCLGCESSYCTGWVQTSDESWAEQHWAPDVVEEARRFRDAHRTR